ncbi:MAG: hypothetical protein AMJ53_06130 [Gammaproteobacteria bacterium SG8_11]|nr:MAG: hypothetical protein AMJ53_06130 [Gammaproteobacteria bacterium SG8_11]
MPGDPIICPACHALAFQYKFFLRVGETIGALSFILMIVLFFIPLWLYGTLFLAVAVLSYFTGRYFEVKFNSLKLEATKRKKLVQIGFSISSLIIGFTIFVLLTKLLPTTDPLLNMLVLDPINWIFNSN